MEVLRSVVYCCWFGCCYFDELMTLFSENLYPYAGFYYRLQQDGNWFKIYLSQLLYKKDFPLDKGNQKGKTILLAAQFAQRPALN